MNFDTQSDETLLNLLAATPMLQVYFLSKQMAPCNRSNELDYKMAL